VPRFPRLLPTPRFGGSLFAAACAVALGCGVAAAQIVTPDNSDPLTPKLQTDPRKPPQFQKFTAPQQTQLTTPAFTEPPSAAGDTGYDSTNSRKAKEKSAASKKTKSKTKAADDAYAAGQAPPATVSPYQKPFPLTGVYASAPGNPPPTVEIGPIRKKPIKHKAHSEPDDPYAPLGVQAGSFTLFPAVELTGGYNTNPAQTTTNAKGATLYTIAPELRAQSNWSRHELKADLRGSYTGYSPDSDPSLNRPYVNGKADGRIDVTKSTRIDLTSRVLVGTDNPGSPDLQAGLAKLPIYTTYGGSAGVGQKFNRFDLSVKGDAERTFYQDSRLTNGASASNQDRNFNQYGGTLRGGYELLPGVSPFVEATADTRKHDLATDLTGYRRDSNGLTGKVGTSFELSRLLTGEVSVGFTNRKYDDSRLENLSGLIGDASLIWTANSLTTVKLSASSSVGETTVPGVSGVLYRSAGLQVDHAFRRWLIGSVKLGVGADDYDGLGRLDKHFSAGAGLTYKLNQFAQIKGEFRQDWTRSNVTGNDYTASIFMLGLRLQR
jgi:hypothetical protein